MAAPEEDFIDTFYNSIGDLHSVRKSLNKEYAADLKKILQRAAKDISDHTGEFLHQLHEKKPDEDTLQKMISASPSSLSYVDEDDQLPIQSAMYDNNSLIYVSLLAKEGVKHKVGGEDGRGGLLVVDPFDTNGDTTLHLLVRLGSEDNPERDLYDKACVDIMKELNEANLLTKDDIEDHDLLYHTCRSQGIKQRFEFLHNWCPEGLTHHQYGDHPLIHAIIKNMPIELFATFLKASTKHHTDEAGLLFQTDSDGMTACQRAFDKYGKKETMQVIGNCFPFDNPQLPILHYVAKHAPKLLNYFSVRYTSASYLRDSDGRNLNQAMLASGNYTFEDNAMHFNLYLSDDQVREIDPATDLYPFMVAASSETARSDLSAVYVLLKRNPSLVRGGNLDNEDRHSNSRRKRKGMRRNSNCIKRNKRK